MENPIPRMMLMTSNILGSAEEADQQIAPLDVQLAAKPGDYGMIAFGTSTIEHDLMVAQILDPEEHKETFPDYEDRLWKGYVLCRWNSLGDPDGDIGWFSRVKFVALTKEQYEEVYGWFKEGKAPDSVPDWMDEIYTEYTMAIHHQAPDRIPTVIKCDSCGSAAKNELHIRVLEKYSGRAGLVERDGKPTYYLIADEDRKEETAAHLHCKNCGHRKQIEVKHLGDSHTALNVQIHRL